MKYFAYIFALICIIAWAIAYFGFRVEDPIIHLFLLVAAVTVILNLIRAKGKAV